MEGNISSFRSEAALRTGQLMWQVFPPFLIGIGTLGNVLSILVLTKPSISKSSYSVYLLGLAVTDTCMLYIGLLRQWIKHVFEIDVRYSSDVACKLHRWLVYTNADVCAWILTIITLERLVSTIFPTKMSCVCSRRNAKIILVVTGFVAMVFNSHLLYGFGRQVTRDGNITTVMPCAPVSEAYEQFYDEVWSWVDFCKASLVPFAILTFGNGLIIRTLFQSSKRVRTTSSRSNISKLLVSLNFIFIICTAPICVYLIGDGYWTPSHIPREIRDRDPIWATVNLLLYLSNTVNFFLYCLSGSKFRRELRKLYQDTINNTRRLSRAWTTARPTSTTSDII